jgi:hypothetical protein
MNILIEREIYNLILILIYLLFGHYGNVLTTTIINFTGGHDSADSSNNRCHFLAANFTTINAQEEQHQK